MRERIVVGLSGGVDSSVAAALLVAEGHEVIGVTLRVWPWREPEDAARRFGSCCSPETVDDARAVARRLGIPYYLLNTEREFDATVIEPFAQAYASGHTPVPCVACNRHVKFGSLLARARAWGATAVATGHYARLDTDATTGRRLLYRAADPRKDQSDFLWPLTQDQLASARFPVGAMSKTEVRAQARELGLCTADRPESQEICFVPQDDYRAFLRARRPDAFEPGPIVDEGGTVRGRHRGLSDFTVGQRRGLGLSLGQPLYVTRLEPESNTVVVGPRQALDVTTVHAEDVNLIAVERLDGPLRVTARIRHGQAPAPATLWPGAAPTRVEVRFDEPQRAASPGQSLVFYQDDLVVGGGVIARA